MSYTHLSQWERYQIRWLRKGGWSLEDIAAMVQPMDATLPAAPVSSRCANQAAQKPDTISVRSRSRLRRGGALLAIVRVRVR